MHMIENDQPKTLRPLQPLVNTVEQQGLVVLNYVTSLPIVGEQYISPYYVISLCERGTVEVEYDMKQFVFHPNDFTIMPVLYEASILSPERRAVPTDEPGIRPVGVGKFHRSDMPRGNDAQRIPHHHHDAL